MCERGVRPDAHACCPPTHMNVASASPPAHYWWPAAVVIACCCCCTYQPCSACCLPIQHCPHPPNVHGPTCSRIQWNECPGLGPGFVCMRLRRGWHTRFASRTGTTSAGAPFPRLLMNTCNIKHLLQHMSETDETFTTCVCNICIWPLSHMQHPDKTIATYI
jgi:hypothetical protein